MSGANRGRRGETDSQNKIFVVFSMSSFKISQNLRAGGRTIHRVLTFLCTWIRSCFLGCEEANEINCGYIVFLHPHTSPASSSHVYVNESRGIFLGIKHNQM